MNIFITGASGFIGNKLAVQLADKGNTIHILLRKDSSTQNLHHPQIKHFTGDLSDKKSMGAALNGCTQVYHLAGLASMWNKNKSRYYEVNVTGTRNLLEAAQSEKVAKIVVTSTAGVFPPTTHELITEQSPKRPELYTEYERTKHLSEEVAKEFIRQGMHIVIVNPSNVYGPGPVNDNNASTRMIRDYVKGKWKMLPGSGRQLMNYVYIDDVVEGMMLAMEKAPAGAQYILGGNNASFLEFFQEIKELTGAHNRLYHIPLALVQTFARIELFKATVFGIKPKITPEWVRKLYYNWSKDISKATTELLYQPRSLRKGIEDTVQWLKQKGELSE